MNDYVEKLRSTLTKEQFDDVLEYAIERASEREPETLEKILPSIAENMRAEGYSEGRSNSALAALRPKED